MNQNMDESAKTLLNAVPKMRELGIPVTPDNYAVWYSYFTGDDKVLVRAIDTLISSGTTFNSEVCAGLHSNFIVSAAPKALENVHVETQMLVNRLFNSISQLSKGTQHFQAYIEEFGGKVGVTNDRDMLNHLLIGVLSEVDKLIKENAIINDSLKSMTQELNHLKDEMGALSVVSQTDKLTGLYNRRAFENYLSKAQTQGRNGCCLLLIDIDHFKLFNDRYGHITGDKVLVYVAHQFKLVLNADEFAARYGGEEFVVILKDTSLEQAIQIAETLRSSISDKKLTIGKDHQDVGTVTVSIGVTQSQVGESADDLFDRADKALYAAKHAGRNQVRSAV